MSNDISICVLETTDGFRVRAVAAPQNLYHWDSERKKMEFSIPKITEAFGAAPKYREYSEAMQEAEELSKEYFSEYGVVVIREFMFANFYDLQAVAHAR